MKMYTKTATNIVNMDKERKIQSVERKRERKNCESQVRCICIVPLQKTTSIQSYILMQAHTNKKNKIKSAPNVISMAE